MSRYSTQLEWQYKENMSVKRIWEHLQQDNPRLLKATIKVPYLGTISLERKDTLEYYGGAAFDDEEGKQVESAIRNYENVIVVRHADRGWNLSSIWKPFLTYEGLRDWLKITQKREKQLHEKGYLTDELPAEDDEE